MVATAILDKRSFSSGFARPQLLSYELQAVCRQLNFSPEDLVGAGRRSQIQHKIPLLGVGAPMLLDEGLGLPVSLASAFQTFALYQGMSWELTSNRKYLVSEFFRQYTTLLFRDTINLCVIGGVSLDLALANLVITIARGEPQNLQLRQIQVTNELPQAFISRLLDQNLRPLVTELVRISGVDSELMWDTAIEALLEVLGRLNLEPRQREQIRRSMMIEELSPGLRVILLNNISATKNSPFIPDEWVYAKRKCCQSFRKGERCRSCPGRKKK